jgi:thiamine-phosphate pyrophosphorylase
MSITDTFGLYAILTDPVLGYDYLTRLLVDEGVSFIQLRIKDRGEEELKPLADELRKLIPERGPTRYIINDYPSLCVAAGADGVHIGQGDQPYSDARRIAGNDAIIGISTHSPDQTRNACALSPDYIGVGPVYPTPTKKNPDPVIGTGGMRAMLREATVPAVAIGGIDLSNLREVLQAGARNFCMVRQINQSREPAKVLRRMREIMRSAQAMREI